jgi:hypothetical protein
VASVSCFAFGASRATAGGRWRRNKGTGMGIGGARARETRGSPFRLALGAREGVTLC